MLVTESPVEIDRVTFQTVISEKPFPFSFKQSLCETRLIGAVVSLECVTTVLSAREHDSVIDYVVTNKYKSKKQRPIVRQFNTLDAAVECYNSWSSNLTSRSCV